MAAMVAQTSHYRGRGRAGVSGWAAVVVVVVVVAAVAVAVGPAVLVAMVIEICVPPRTIPTQPHFHLGDIEIPR